MAAAASFGVYKTQPYAVRVAQKSNGTTGGDLVQGEAGHIPAAGVQFHRQVVQERVLRNSGSSGGAQIHKWRPAKLDDHQWRSRQVVAAFLFFLSGNQSQNPRMSVENLAGNRNRARQHSLAPAPEFSASAQDPHMVACSVAPGRGQGQRRIERIFFLSLRDQKRWRIRAGYTVVVRSSTASSLGPRSGLAANFMPLWQWSATEQPSV